MSKNPEKIGSKGESLALLNAGRFLASVSRFIFSADYTKFRVWGLIIFLIIFAITGQLLTKTALLILSIVIGYIFLTYFVKWFDKRNEK